VRRLLRTRPAAWTRPSVPSARTGRAAGTGAATRTRRATRTGRLSGRWLTALLITGTLALLVPGVSYATASQSSPARQSAPAAVTVGCQGVTPAVIPALGFVTNPSRSQAGHLWWRAEAGGVCVGTVIEWVQYNTTATKTWQVIVYTAQHPDGQVVAQRTFTLGPGWYWWSFGVHQVFQGLSAVCITASDSFGMPCLHFST
jgi:hypothetical protein